MLDPITMMDLAEESFNDRSIIAMAHREECSSLYRFLPRHTPQVISLRNDLPPKMTVSVIIHELTHINHGDWGDTWGIPYEVQAEAKNQMRQAALYLHRGTEALAELNERLWFPSGGAAIANFIDGSDCPIPQSAETWPVWDAFEQSLLASISDHPSRWDIVMIKGRGKACAAALRAVQAVVWPKRPPKACREVAEAYERMGI
jgi:hypothetical protein